MQRSHYDAHHEDPLVWTVWQPSGINSKIGAVPSFLVATATCCLSARGRGFSLSSGEEILIINPFSRSLRVTCKEAFPEAEKPRRTSCAQPCLLPDGWRSRCLVGRQFGSAAACCSWDTPRFVPWSPTQPACPGAGQQGQQSGDQPRGCGGSGSPTGVNWQTPALLPRSSRPQAALCAPCRRQGGAAARSAPLFPRGAVTASSSPTRGQEVGGSAPRRQWPRSHASPAALPQPITAPVFGPGAPTGADWLRGLAGRGEAKGCG